MTAYVVAGSQATRAEDEEDEESDNEESEDEHEAALESKASPHPGGVNRVRAMPQAGHIVATWADTGKLHMLQPRWNLDAHRKALDKGDKAPHSVKPIFTSEFHKDEAAKMTDFRLIWTCFAMQGFAMDFSPNEAGRNDSQIHLWAPVPGGSRAVFDPSDFRVEKVCPWRSTVHPVIQGKRVLPCKRLVAPLKLSRLDR
ncbi:Glutamate-rich WD repeat-containing protein 1 [Durusdinium trenchii]|uniref:Glutamate-rich WD repeat-containing protein 1 n=1 Tax=Durusdinium trenchii TaxID=1381693 RepID=A0ABP0PJE1_9DINO